MSLNLAVVVADPLTRDQRVARVKVPPALPRFAALPGGDRFVPLEQVISAHLDALFPGMDILTHQPFRLTRGADFQLDSDEDDLLEAVRDVLKRRRLSPLVVRLEVDEQMSRRGASTCSCASWRWTSATCRSCMRRSTSPRSSSSPRSTDRS